MPKVSRPGSGRTKGSYSFVIVPLEQLNAKFNDPKQPITVGRKWAEMQGFTGLVANPAGDTAAKIEGSTPENKSGVTVTSLDE